jgi:hypothetical protein
MTAHCSLDDIHNIVKSFSNCKKEFLQVGNQFRLSLTRAITVIKHHFYFRLPFLTLIHARLSRHVCSHDVMWVNKALRHRSETKMSERMRRFCSIDDDLAAAAAVTDDDYHNEIHVMR